MSEKLIYRPIPKFTPEEIDSAIAQDDIDALSCVAISVGQYGNDWKYAQDLCIQLSGHANATVRGNAILGLSYVARFQGNLDKRLVKPILLRALRDPEETVRSRAEDAIIDINHILKWKLLITKEKIKWIEEMETMKNSSDTKQPSPFLR